MLRLIKTTAFFFLILALGSCEYNLKEENFVEIEPPTEILYFDLDLIPAGDTIKIFDKTNLNFSFNTGGLEVLASILTLRDRRWEFLSNSGSITIDPQNNMYAQDTLTLSIYLKSGTGSIADHSGMEGYFLEKKWLVIQDSRPAPKIIPTKRINEDGFLIIEWPKCDRYNFVQYEVGGSNPYGIFNEEITDANKNYYIDSLYVGGDYHISVSCRLKNSHTWGEPLKFSVEPPQLFIKELGYDSLSISWSKSPFNAKYRLEISASNILYFDSKEDTVCTIPQIGFGQFKRFELCTRSIFQKWQDPSYYGQVASYKDYSLGKRIIGANRPEFAYNVYEKVLYSNEYNHLKCFDIKDYSLENTVDLNQLIYAGEYSCPTNSSKIAVTTGTNIYIFEDKNLNSPKIINYKEWGDDGLDHFLLTDNDIIAFAAKDTYKQIDINTMKTIVSLTIADYPVYSRWACITTSQDARYLCSVTRNGIELFHTVDGKTNEIYTDTRNYRSAYFNPFNPDQLYLTLNEERGIEIRNPKDFSLINRIDIPAEMVIRNIDPETLHLLVTDYVHLFIIDTITHKILLKVPCDEAKSWLYNSNLFTNTGFGLNVSEDL